MKKIGATLFAVTAIFAGACGDDSSSDGNDADSDNDNDTDADNDNDNDIVIPDADDGDDIDAPIDGGLPAGCDYLELNDLGNGVTAADAWEQTQLSITESTTFCGSIANDHFENGLHDRDGYSFSVPAETKAIVTVTGPAAGLTGDDLPFFFVIERVVDGETFTVFGADPSVPGELRSFGTLPAGEYIVAFGAAGEAALAAPLDYKFNVIIDTTNGCAPASGTNAFTELLDVGAADTANDFIVPGGTATPAADAAELTNHTTTATSDFVFGGTSTARATATGGYYDRDTFEFTTGADTTQVRLRLNWPSTGMDADMNPLPDLDYYIYEKNTDGTPGAEIAVGATADPSERTITRVMPGKSYYVWVAGYESEAAADELPATYQLRLCGGTFQ